jgi:F-type H+-transporting ATPase subunit gamma
MASLRQIRQRMKAIHNIHEITKAMGMIASFRFKRAENRFTRSRNYFLEMEKLVMNLSAAINLEDPRHQNFGGQALFEKRKMKKKTLVVMTGDKGLCGAYNTNILKEASQWRAQNGAFEISIVPVGKVGNDWFRRRRVPVLTAYPEKAMVDLSLAKKMTENLKVLFLEGKTDSVELLYTTYRAGMPGKSVVLPYLGLSYLLENSTTRKEDMDYIYEPDFNTVFLSLLSCYFEGKIYMTLLESLTSESSARMLAMKQATDNAEDVLDNLKLLRNKTRQATITRELSEIVSGACVLV